MPARLTHSSFFVTSLTRRCLHGGGLQLCSCLIDFLHNKDTAKLFVLLFLSSFPFSVMTSGIAQSIILCVHVSFPAYHTEVSLSCACCQFVCCLLLCCLITGLSISSVSPSSSGRAARGAGGGEITLMAIMTADAEQRETFLTMSVDPLYQKSMPACPQNVK